MLEMFIRDSLDSTIPILSILKIRLEGNVFEIKTHNMAYSCLARRTQKQVISSHKRPCKVPPS